MKRYRGAAEMCYSKQCSASVLDTSGFRLLTHEQSVAEVENIHGTSVYPEKTINIHSNHWEMWNRSRISLSISPNIYRYQFILSIVWFHITLIVWEFFDTVSVIKKRIEITHTLFNMV